MNNKLIHYNNLLADAADLKSADPKGLWGFESPSRHHELSPRRPGPQSRRPRSLRFQRHGAREEDVVLQVDMLVKVGFESLQGLEQRPIANAGIAGNGVIVGNCTERTKGVSCSIMLLHHHPYRIHNRPEHRGWRRLARENALLHPEDVRKEDLLLLHQVDT